MKRKSKCLKMKDNPCKSVHAVLYKYNIDAIESASGRKVSEINNLEDKLNYALGYIDYTNTSIIKEMIEHSEGPEQGGYPVSLVFYDYNIESFIHGLEEIGKSYKDIDNQTFDKMINYALGYIDYGEVFSMEEE